MESERKTSVFDSAEVNVFNAHIHFGQVKITRLMGNQGLLHSELHKAYNKLDQDYTNKCNILERQVLDLRKELEKEKKEKIDLVGLLNGRIFERNVKISDLTAKLADLKAQVADLQRLRADGTKSRPQGTTASTSDDSDDPSSPPLSCGDPPRLSPITPQSQTTTINFDTPPSNNSNKSKSELNNIKSNIFDGMDYFGSNEDKSEKDKDTEMSSAFNVGIDDIRANIGREKQEKQERQERQRIALAKQQEERKKEQDLDTAMQYTS